MREVIVADAAGTDDIAALAEEAGARLVAAGERSFALACAEARREWLLLLRAGTRLEAGWGEAAWRHMAERPGQAGWFQLSLRGGWPRAAVGEATAALAAAWFGRLRAEHGLLIPHMLLEAARERGNSVRLPLRLGAGRAAPIAARILAEL